MAGKVWKNAAKMWARQVMVDLWEGQLKLFREVYPNLNFRCIVSRQFLME
jgi:hypothetical protein